jgi:diguanylate cyclase (GGDEF)-like protein
VHSLELAGYELAVSALVLIVVRLALTVLENIQMADSSKREALTDALTGLGNRRKLMFDVEVAVAGEGTTVLVMFDLDGFKLYNDQFGHLAGDTMLAHLGHRLQHAVGGVGEAYRLGGDEFCVLLRCDLADAGEPIAAVVDALSSHGDGFAVGASHGMVEIPAEAESPTLALRLADHRMYAKKGNRRGSAGEQTHKVLLGLLKEREPDLHDHLCHVGELAADVARKLGLDAGQADEIRRAAELHDIGKAAVPDAILNKPGPLDEHEWAFMRRHTYVGERILAAAPSLAGVAPLVRSSHERWDGEGYPDGLIGDAIALGARIIAVCDAFDAMTTTRPYAAARPAESAIAEVRRAAGTQFDPHVVDAFVVAWHDRGQRRHGEDVVDAAAA